jgi:hypothetical protein
MIDLRLQENIRRVGGLSKLWEDYKGAYPSLEELQLAQLDANVGSIATTYDNNKLYMFDGTTWQEIVGIGGVSNLNSLSDVSVSTPTNGQFITYNSTLGIWQNTNLAAYLDTLLDVNTSGVTSGQFLRYNGISWVASTASTPTELTDLSDVDTTGVTNGNVLIYNATTGNWEPSAPSNPTVISDLTDVSSASPVTNQVLTWNGTQWIPVTPTIPATNIADLNDVTVTTPIASNLLQYNGTNWVNVTTSAILLSSDYKGSYATSLALSTAYPSASGNNWAIVEGIIWVHDGIGGWTSTAYEIWDIDSTTQTELENLTNFDTNNEYQGGSIIADDLVAGKRHKHSSIDGVYFEVLEDDTWFRIDLRMPRETLGVVVTDNVNAATPSTTIAKYSMVVPYDCDIIDAVCSTTEAPVGSNAILDIHYETTPTGTTGTTIFSTKPTIDATTYTTMQSGTSSVLATTSLSKGGMLHFFVDQVGSTTAGKGYTALLNLIRKD